LEGGTVKQQMLSLDQPLDQEALSRFSNQLNDLLAGLTWRQMAGQLLGLPPIGRQVGGLVMQALQGLDGQETLPLYRDGLVHILGEPEFAEGQQVRQMVRTLEGPGLADVVMTAAQPLEVGGVQVLIGGEGRWQEFTDLSLVLSRYGVAGGASGLLGVIGPVRMTYDRTIGAVRYVSRLMSDLVSDWYNFNDELPADESPLVPR
jgi:heat-inducible transcriptional repressor